MGHVLDTIGVTEDRPVVVCLRDHGAVSLKTADAGLASILAFEGILDGQGPTSLGFRVTQFWDRKGVARAMRFNITVPLDNIASLVEVPEDK